MNNSRELPPATSSGSVRGLLDMQYYSYTVGQTHMRLLTYSTASRIPPGRFIWKVGVIEIWLIGLVFPFGLIGAPLFLVVGVLWEAVDVF